MTYNSSQDSTINQSLIRHNLTVTAPDAELLAITLGIQYAVQAPGVEHIMVFTDHIASARRAVDPSAHSGQSLSLAVC